MMKMEQPSIRGWVIGKNDKDRWVYLKYISMVGVLVLTFQTDEAQFFGKGDGNYMRKVINKLNEKDGVLGATRIWKSIKVTRQ